MLVIFGYLLGYLTCWLEWHGFSGPALLSGLSACALLLVRIMSGEVLRPFTKHLYSWSKRKTRLRRVFLMWTHYWYDHGGHHHYCTSCAIQAPPAEQPSRKGPGTFELS